jgi:enamine deaminase RidA (YjgF/YER057c/UK114 family)
LNNNLYCVDFTSMEAPAVPRKLISSGSYLEPEIGFSRAVRVGQFVAIAGTAPIAAAGGTAAPGDVYGQTIRCFEIIAKAVAEAGGTLANIIRTRIMLTDISSWRDAARAHGEVFCEIRPACTFVEVSGFIDPTWLVEIEADCVVE